MRSLECILLNLVCALSSAFHIDGSDYDQNRYLQQNNDEETRSGGSFESGNIIMIIILVSLFVCCCYGARPNGCFNDGDNSVQNRAGDWLRRNVAYRDDLVDSYKEGSWDCEVCGFRNDPGDDNCRSCGTEYGFQLFPGSTMYNKLFPENSSARDVAISMSSSRLTYDDRLTRSTIVRGKSGRGLGDSFRATEGSFGERQSNLRYSKFKTEVSEMVAQQSSFAAAGMEKRGLSQINRQRAFAIRRLNMLNTRQKAGLRRKEWVRRADKDGKLVWTRHADLAVAMANVWKSKKAKKRAAKNEIFDDTSALVSPNDAEKKDNLELSQGLGVSDVQQGFVSQVVRSQSGTQRLTFAPANEAESIRKEDATYVVEISAEDFEHVASLPFKEKYTWFTTQMASLKQPWENGHCNINIMRDNILIPSLSSLAEIPKNKLHSPWRYHFDGEAAIDAGGVEREWYTLIVTAIFEDGSNLFMSTMQAEDGYMISPLSAEAHGNMLEGHYLAIGRLLGRALFAGQTIDAHLSIPLLKHLLGVPITFADLEFVDIETYSSLRWLEDAEDASVLGIDFTTEQVMLNGKTRTVELKQGGHDIDVTNENKMEYLRLKMKYIMLDSMAVQLRFLLKGLYEVVPQELLSVFDYQELELMLNGVPTISLEDWQKETKLAGIDNPQLIIWFWEIVGTFSEADKAKLLQFCTGSSRVPIQGFKALQANDGRLCPFTLNIIEMSVSFYPRSHTCFNRLDLPNYQTLAELEDAMTLVMNMEVTGFTIE